MSESKFGFQTYSGPWKETRTPIYWYLFVTGVAVYILLEFSESFSGEIDVFQHSIPFAYLSFLLLLLPRFVVCQDARWFPRQRRKFS